MCPLCLSAAAWLAIGGGSAMSMASLIAALRLKGNDDGDDRDDTSHCNS
jgi:alcohol dehydrogenase class IV